VLEGSLGTRLRLERERRQIALADVAARTKILGALLEGLERDDVSRWPTGLYRRSFIRAYAQAIGLDPEPVLREFLACFPDTDDPTAAVPSPPRMCDEGGDTPGGLRLTLAESETSFVGGRLLALPRSRWAAAFCDATIVAAIVGGVLATAGDVWLPISVGVVTYFVGGILLLGNTPGVWLCAPRPMQPDLPAVRHAEETGGSAGLWSMGGHDTAWALSPGSHQSHERASSSAGERIH
jgi:transcriptional regulator with XRE-family HTH domain